jgi:hypothetical protein
VEQGPGVLVPAVFAPHGAEKPEFEKVGLSAQALDYGLVFGLREG